MPSTDTPTGALLGNRYLLLRPIGQGASASVYLAEDQSLRREVAVKVLRTGLAHDDAFRKRFRAEAVAVAGLNNPHILRVFDWGEADGDAWLVTEFLAGGSLRGRLDELGRLEVADAVAIGAQAADGLAYAHARGFVHRDVKPANLLFDDAGRVRIADFGVARALAEAQWTEPSEGLIGTVRYSSPEQAQGHHVDGKADVYSLALVLYECVTGEVPFVADTQVATLHARIGATIPFHPALGELHDVLSLASDPIPAQRLSAAELLTALNAIGRDLDPDHVPPSRPQSAIGFTPPSAEELTGPHRVVGRGTTRTAPRPDDVTEVGPIPDATVVGAQVAPPPPTRPEEPAAPASVGHGRRRWPVVAVVLALAAGGLAAGLLTTDPFAAPTYPVPLLVNLSVPQARAALGHGETLRVDQLVNSRTTPAGIVLHQEPFPGTLVAAGTVIHVTASAGPPPQKVVPVVGMTCAAAVAALRHVGFQASCPSALAAYSSTVTAGLAMGLYDGNAANPSSAAYGATLQVQLSKGPAPVPVPNVVGLPGLQAVSTLRQSGFAPFVTRQFDRAVHAGNVIATAPAAPTPLLPGQGVHVIISNGAPATVPSLGHADLAVAEAIIVHAGLTVLAVHGPTTSHTWTTQPPAGTVVSQGSAVTLYGS